MNAPVPLPRAYALKRFLAQHAHRFWMPPDVSGVLDAPIYFFPNQDNFDDDAVERLAWTIVPGTLKLPHDRVIFEVVENNSPRGHIASYVRETDRGVDAFLFRFYPERNVWSDVLVHTLFAEDGIAEPAINPGITIPEDQKTYMEVACFMVWRALGLLAGNVAWREQTVSRLRRAPFAKHGVSGWTYRVVDIEPARIAAALGARGGTHASPRWHIRRGHWRHLNDGRQVFVRECQVGDQTRGGVVKDYQVQFGAAA